MTEKIKQANTQAKEILQFAKQMLQILFTLSILGLGIYAIALGKLDTDTLINLLDELIPGSSIREAPQPDITFVI